MTLKNMRSTQGYTIDQTILIVAIIAILITLIIITVGWNLITKTSGTKLASQVRQIEDAAGQFYSTYRLWPQQAYTTPTGANNFRLLAGVTQTGIATQVTSIGLRNFVPGFTTTTAGGRHTMGSGGAVTLTEVTNPFGEFANQRFLVVEFANVPLNEAREADMAIDGGSTANFTTGRFQAAAGGASCAVNTAPTAPTGQLANVCYAANLIQ